MFKLNFFTVILIGVAAGAAIAYLFDTEEGKELSKKFQDKTSELEKELRNDFEKLASEV